MSGETCDNFLFLDLDRRSFANLIFQDSASSVFHAVLHSVLEHQDMFFLIYPSSDQHLQSVSDELAEGPLSGLTLSLAELYVRSMQ